MFVFVSGASSSGKSEWAEQTALKLADRDRDVVKKFYLATAHVGEFDLDMQRRVARHRERRRDRGFITIERERDLAELVTGSTPRIARGSLVLLECLPNWLANEMFAPLSRDGDHDGARDVKSKCDDGDKIANKIMIAVSALRAHTAHLIVVSDDIFSDGVVYDPMTENYIELLGVLHVKLAALSDMAVECASALAHIWKCSSRL